MTETVLMEDVVDGARLLALGMRPKLIPSRDLIYAELVKRFAEDGPFRELTEAIAEGLGLKVLAVSSRTGVVLGPAESSVFEQKFDDYARRTVLGERRDLERVLHGIAHLAIAALAFPRPGRPGHRHVRRAGVGRAGRQCGPRGMHDARREGGSRRRDGGSVGRGPRAGAGVARLSAPPRDRAYQGRRPPLRLRAASSRRRCGSSPIRGSWLG